MKRKPELVWFYRAVLGGVVAFFLFHAMRMAWAVPLPLGHDIITYYFPIGRFLREASFSQFFHGLIASFRFEDHLGPMSYVYGWLLQFSPLAPEPTTHLASKALFLVNLGLTLMVTWRLWKEALRLVVIAALIAFNVDFIWSGLVAHYASHVATFGLLAFYFLIRHLQTTTWRDFSFFCLFYFLSLMSFETSFVEIPAFGIFSFLFLMTASGSLRERFRRLAPIAFALVVLFIPYLWAHHHVFQTFLPTSRGKLPTDLWAHYASLWAQFFDVYFYGWGSALSPSVNARAWTIISVLLAAGTIRGALFSKMGGFLYIATLVQILCVVYTNRVQEGLWIFTGICLHLSVADFLFTVSRRVGDWLSQAWHSGPWSSRRPGAHPVFLRFSPWRVAVGYLILLGLFIKVGASSEEVFREYYQRSKNANFRTWERATKPCYRALDEPLDQFSILRLPDVAEGLWGAEAIWLGNKIHHGAVSLRLYPEANMFIAKEGMLIQLYPNPSGAPFSKYRPYLQRQPARQDALLVQSKNICARVFLDRDDERIYRGVVVYPGETPEYVLNLPLFDESEGAMRVTLGFIEAPQGLEAVVLNGREIRDWRAPDALSIEFESSDLASAEGVRLQLRMNSGKAAALERIQVRRAGPARPQKMPVASTFAELEGINEIRIEAKTGPHWMYFNSTEFSAMGVAPAGETVRVGGPLPILASLKENFTFSGYAISARRLNRTLYSQTLNGQREFEDGVFRARVEPSFSTVLR